MAKEVCKAISIPVIGIGAGVEVDGQVLVFHDLIDYGVERVPKFVKQYESLNALIQKSIESYADDVKNKRFPEEKHSFTMEEAELKGLYGGKK